MMTFLLNILGIGGVLSAVAKAFGSLIEAVAPVLGKILHALVDFIVWYAKKFIQGLGIILNNLSTLAVIIALVLGTAWFTRSNCPTTTIRCPTTSSKSTSSQQKQQPQVKPKLDWVPW